jgi:hypothetical protein
MLFGDQIKKKEMGGACSIYERWLQSFSRETWGNETTWKTQGSMKG